MIPWGGPVFKLYPLPEKGTFRFADYALLMQEVARIGAKSVLEFGPGISTFALIEAGADNIVTLEHDPEWFDKAVESFTDYPQVTVARYVDEPQVTADDVALREFDMAFVDSPKGFTWKVPGVKGVRKKHPGMEDCSRLNTCLFALEHAPIVYLHDAIRPLERGTLGRLSGMGHQITYLHNSKSGIARIERNGQNAARPNPSGA